MSRNLHSNLIILSVSIISICYGLKCPDHWIDASHVDLGCLYFDTRSTMTWSQSEQLCYQANNAHLLEIYSQFQQDFVTMMALFLEESSGGKRHWWIGLSDAGSEGKWYWSNSLKPVNFIAWYDNQPDSGINANYAFMAFGYDYKWADAGKENTIYPLCQFFI